MKHPGQFHAADALADKIANRVCQHLAHLGWLEGDDQSALLSNREHGLPAKLPEQVV